MKKPTRIEKIYTGVLGRFEKHYEPDGQVFLKATIADQFRNILIPSYVDRAGSRFYGWRQEYARGISRPYPSFVEGPATRERPAEDSDIIALAFADWVNPGSTFSVRGSLRPFHLDPAYLTNSVVPWIIDVRPDDLDADWQWDTVPGLRPYFHSGMFMGVVSVLEDRLGSGVPQTS